MTVPGSDLTTVDPAGGEELPGIYLHIPFCKSRCAYCSFNSYACHSPPAAYLAALVDQIRHWAGRQWCRERSFASLFIGGGTPTIYDGGELAALVGLCRELFNFSEEPEITVEANPNTVSLPGLTTLRRAGVNRLSLGVQAFSDRLLAGLGRSHTIAEADAAIKGARRAGFANLNLDLMYGLPGQSIANWQESLARALEYEPEHLACYELTIEEGTPFAALVESGGLILPNEEEVLAMAGITGTLLARVGLKRYEISNYAAPGRQCRHNINYWRNGSYLGLGAGAVSCLSGFRFGAVSAPEEFISLVQQGKLPLVDGECLPLAARFRESVVMGLRMIEGVSFAALRHRFALTPPDYYGKMLDELQQQGLVAINQDKMRLTRGGLPVANQVLARLV